MLQLQLLAAVRLLPQLLLQIRCSVCLLVQVSCELFVGLDERVIEVEQVLPFVLKLTAVVLHPFQFSGVLLAVFFQPLLGLVQLVPELSQLGELVGVDCLLRVEEVQLECLLLQLVECLHVFHERGRRVVAPLGHLNAWRISFNSAEIEYLSEMLSQHCLKKLVEYFLKINETEKLLEGVRQAICRNSYFQLETAFQRFDKFGKGYLLPSDLSEFMLENGVFPTEDELYLVFKDFDKAKQGVVTLDRFEEELLPKENAQLRKEVLHRKFYPPSVRLEEDLEFQLGKYFQGKLDCYIKLNDTRIELVRDGSWSTSKAFLVVDKKNAGQLLNKDSIDEFLRNNGKLLKCE